MASLTLRAPCLSVTDLSTAMACSAGTPDSNSMYRYAPGGRSSRVLSVKDAAMQVLTLYLPRSRIRDQDLGLHRNI